MELFSKIFTNFDSSPNSGNKLTLSAAMHPKMHLRIPKKARDAGIRISERVFLVQKFGQFILKKSIELSFLRGYQPKAFLPNHGSMWLNFRPSRT